MAQRPRRNLVLRPPKHPPPTLSRRKAHLVPPPLPLTHHPYLLPTTNYPIFITSHKSPKQQQQLGRRRTHHQPRLRTRLPQPDPELGRPLRAMVSRRPQLPEKSPALHGRAHPQARRLGSATRLHLQQQQQHRAHRADDGQALPALWSPHRTTTTWQQREDAAAATAAVPRPTVAGAAGAG